MKKAILIAGVMFFAFNTLAYAAGNWNITTEEILKVTEQAEKLAENLKNIAVLLITLFATVALVIAYFKFQNLQSFDFHQIISRIVIVFILLALYQVIVNGVCGIVDGISHAMYSGDIVDSLSKILEKRVQESQELKDKGVLERLKEIASGIDVTIMNYIATMAATFLSWCMTIMGIIRFVTLNILYAVGVLTIPLIIFPAAARVAKGWFIAVIEVASWVIFWKLLLIFFTVFQPQEVIGGSAFIFVGLYYITIGCLILWTPKIVSGLARGAGIGEGLSFAGVTAMGFGQRIISSGARSVGIRTERLRNRQRKAGGVVTIEGKGGDIVIPKKYIKGK